MNNFLENIGEKYFNVFDLSITLIWPPKLSYNFKRLEDYSYGVIYIKWLTIGPINIYWT